MRILISILLTVIMVGCGSTESDMQLEDGLTVNYVNQELQLEGFSTNGTTLIFEDGFQWGTPDLNRVIVSRVDSSTSGPAFSFAYSINHSGVESVSRFVAFYIDVDNDPNTGEFIEGIGADRLLLDDQLYNASGFFGTYFIYSDATSSWLSQASSGLGFGLVDSTESVTRVVQVMPYENISNLFGLIDAAGVLMVRSLENGNPDDINAVTLDATLPFDFNTP